MAESRQSAIVDTEEAADEVRVWEWLVGLLVAGLVVFVLPISRIAAIRLVFAAAIVKATLVVRKYMHLEGAHWLLYLIAFMPAILIIAMALALLPDIAFRQ